MKDLTQSKLESFVETTLNIGSGFILSLLTWIFIVPIIFGITSDFSQSIGITILFTIVSLTRNYIWRRIFNSCTKKKIHKFLDRAN